jgi:hypothetical protein
MNLSIRNQVLNATTELLDGWRADKLNRDDFTELMTLAKENGDWVQIAAIALATACILEDAVTGDPTNRLPRVL